MSHVLERTVLIRARRSTVFRYFSDPARFAAWWGEGSTIDTRPGGLVQIRYPNGVTAGGAVEEVVPDRRIVFSYGYDDPGKPVPRGGSRVTITLEDHPEGTLLRLVHDLADPAARDAHLPGWRFQLSLFANVVTRDVHAGLAALVDRYFAAWAAEDPAAALEDVVTDDVELLDGFASVTGRGELAAHILAARLHMPGVTLLREGAPLECQGTALVDWVARAADGTSRGRGMNVLGLAPERRVRRVVGFWRG